MASETDPRVEPGYEFLSSIFDHALSAIVTADDSGTITGWNPQATRTFGWTADEVIGKALHETIIPPKYRKAHVEGFAHWLKTGEGPVLGQVIEIEGLRKDGTEFPIELAISPVVRHQKSALLIAFCRDISERRLAEVEMREAAARLHELRLMQEVAERLSFTLDLDAVYGEVVRAAAEMATPPDSPMRRASLLRVAGDQVHGLTEYDASGLTLGQTTYQLATHPVLLQVVETGEPYAGGLNQMPVPPETAAIISRNDLSDAAVVPVRVGELVFALLCVSSRDSVGFSSTQMDRLEAIAQIAGLAIGNAEHFQLMRQHAERSAELERAKSEFLKLASHELRGPLGVLRGYLSMMTEGALDAEQMQHIAPLLSSKLTQINELVNQMLESARLDDSRLELEHGEVDLCTVVRETESALRMTLTPAHTLTVDVPGPSLFVDGDRARLTTVVSNLVDNAIKYSPDGGEVRCELVSKDGAAVLSVRDQGIGIATQDLDRLFKRFGRLVTPQNSHIAGTGLGLYLCRRLARMHGGDITVQSTEGVGTTFTLTLPLMPTVGGG
ncbi:MAG: ATP-binding protein [Candidatus Dormibacteria bacterium]